MGSTFRKGSEQTGQSAGMSNEQGAIASRLLNESQPLRTSSLNQLTNFMDTGKIPMALNVNMAGDIGTQEQELASARNQILDTGVRGGQMTTALAQLPVQRLQARDAVRANYENTLRESLFGTGASMGIVQAPQVGFGGMSAAASNLNSLGEQRQKQNAQFQQGMGQMIGKAVAGSDRRCKTRIRRIGTHALGIGLYEFSYRPRYQAQWGSGRYRGVMAQEVLQVKPEAVLRHADGYLMVDYAALDEGVSSHG